MPTRDNLSGSHSLSYGQPRAFVSPVINATTSSEQSPLIISISTDKNTYTTEEEITINGKIMNLQTSIVGDEAKNRLIVIEVFKVAEANDDQSGSTPITYINAPKIASKDDGSFSHKIRLPDEGTYHINARFADGSSADAVEASNVILVDNSRQFLPLPETVWILPVVGGLIVFSFMFIFLRRRRRDWRWPIAISIISLISGVIVIGLWSPLDPVTNTALSTIFLVPLGTYIFEYVRAREKAESEYEGSVGKYRKEHLETEVNNLVKLYDELTQHFSVFKATIITPTTRLSTSKFAEITKTGVVGTMANLPALMIYRYYQYIDLYNSVLEARGSNPVTWKFNQLDGARARKYKEFQSSFDAVRVAYGEVQSVLYVNLLYDIGEIQHSYLSFPTIEFPKRLSGPLFLMILKAGLLGQVTIYNDNVRGNRPREIIRRDYDQIEYDLGNANDLFGVIERELPQNNIYNRTTAYKLMRQIVSEFSSKYEHLESTIKYLQFIIAGNTPPSVSDQEVLTTKNTEVHITLTSNDPDGDPIAYFIVLPPTNGTINQFDPLTGSIVYTPNPDYAGLDYFTYKTSDGIAISNKSGKVSIVITAS